MLSDMGRNRLPSGVTFFLGTLRQPKRNRDMWNRDVREQMIEHVWHSIYQDENMFYHFLPHLSRFWYTADRHDYAGPAGSWGIYEEIRRLRGPSINPATPYVYMVLSWNWDTPKSSISNHLNRIVHCIPSNLGYPPILGNLHSWFHYECH